MASLNGVGLNGPHSAIANTSGDSLAGLASKDEVLKRQFATREGVYRHMACNDFLQPRVGYSSTPTTNTPVKVSFVSMPDPLGLPVDRICFNVGRELFVFNYRGVKKVGCD